MDVRKVLAEFGGTFLFMTIGYLSVVALGVGQAPGLLVVPFSFGFGLLAAAFAFGHISGGHFNPAVTVAMVLDKRTPPVTAVGYVVAQVVGALAAALLVAFCFDQAAVAGGVTKPGPGVTEVEAFVIEAVLTAGFLLVILTASKRTPAIAGIVIPLTLVAIHFAAATLSGASVNPARTLGTGIVGGDLTSVWVYLVAPVVGGAIGWAVFQALGSGADEV